MSSQTYRGRLRGGSVVLLDKPLPLPDDTCVTVAVIEPQPGSPAAVPGVLNESTERTEQEVMTPEAFPGALAGGPQVTDEDVDAWERAIAEGKRPRSRVDLLGESNTP